MRRIFLLASAVLGCSDEPTAAVREVAPPVTRTAFGSNASGGPADKHISSGASVSANGSDGYLYVNIYAYRIGDSQGQRTYLYYTVYSYSATLAAGSGEIPNGDLVAPSSSSATIDTDLTANPNFAVWYGPRGRIQVSWARDGIYAVKEHGSSMSVSPAFRTHYQGVRSWGSATATGSLLDWELPAGTQGSVGTNHNVQISIERVN
jgi:hypothetical protein